MNDDDIQLIASLVGGDLSEPEATAARDRIDADPELRAAYDEQVAVSAMLDAAPTVAMTAAERDALHSALRTELRLDETAPVAAATATGWSRWWAPLTGLAAAAVVVFAVAIVPNLLDDTGSFDLVGAPAAVTTTAASELQTFGAEEGQAADIAPTTTAAASADAGIAESASQYFLSQTTAGQAELRLAVLDDEAIAVAGLHGAVSEASEFTTIDLNALEACFTGTQGDSLSLAGASEDGSTVYATATDTETDAAMTVKVDISTCVVTKAG